LSTVTPSAHERDLAADAVVAGPGSTRRRSETYSAWRLGRAAAAVRELLRRIFDQRWYLRVMSVTAAAAGVAWAVCLPFGDFAPAFAAASAVYAVQLTVRTSVLDGLRRTALMAMSVMLSVLVLRLVGLSAIAVVALVFVSLAFGRVLRLGVSGSLQVPGTAIFLLALGSTVTTTELFNRVWATLVGAIIGAAASYLAYPGDPQQRARQALSGLSTEIAALLGDMGDGLRERPTTAQATEWLKRSRALSDELKRTTSLVEEATAALRIDPFGKRSETTELSRSLSTLGHSVSQLRGIARTLFDQQLDRGPALPASLAEVLSRTAGAYRAQADALEGHDLSLSAALGAVRDARRESLRSLRRVDETGAWVASGAILTDVDRMISQLEGDSPALEVSESEPQSRSGLAARFRRSEDVR
jgi:uncharacterized membrane protein YgaE (UPF0421/DUF939 family)